MWLTDVDIVSVLCSKEALSKYQEIVNNLEFARELQKSFITLGQEVSHELKWISSINNFNVF